MHLIYLKILHMHYDMYKIGYINAQKNLDPVETRWNDISHILNCFQIIWKLTFACETMLSHVKHWVYM